MVNALTRIEETFSGGTQVVVSASSASTQRLQLVVQLDSSLDLRTNISIYEPSLLSSLTNKATRGSQKNILRVLENVVVATVSQLLLTSRVRVLDEIPILQQPYLSAAPCFQHSKLYGAG